MIAAHNGEVLPIHDVCHSCVQVFFIEQFAHSERLFIIFIGVHGRDAAAGGAEFLAREAIFFQTILQYVVGHRNYRAIGNFKIFGGDFHARRTQFIHFAAKVFQIDYHAVAEHVDHLLS